MKPGSIYLTREDLEALPDAGTPAQVEPGRAARVALPYKARILKLDVHPIFNARDLHDVDDAALFHLPMLGQPGYFVAGSTHLLAAFPKTGKTELMLTCVREWLDTHIPMPRDGEWCPRVLYFTEEGKRTWSRRIKRLPGDPDALGALDVVPAMGMSLKQMMAMVHSYQGDQADWNGDTPGEMVGYDVVVIDTLRSLLGVQDENDSAEIARAVQPWVELSQRTGITVVILHHTRKGGGKYGEGVSGGHGLIGALDIILELNRDGDGNQRTIEVMGREIEPVKGVYERAEIQTAHDMGTGRFELRFVGDRKSVVERVKPLLLVDEWRTTADIRADLDPQPTKDAVTDALVKLCREGYAVREPAIGKDAERKTVFWQRA